MRARSGELDRRGCEREPTAEMKDKVRTTTTTTTNKLGKLSSSNRQQPVRQPTSVSLQSPLWVMRQSRVRLRLPISPSSSPHHSARAPAPALLALPSSLFPSSLPLLSEKDTAPLARSITTALDTHPTYPNARLTSTRQGSRRVVRGPFHAQLTESMKRS